MNEHSGPQQESGRVYWVAGLSPLVPYLGGVLQLVLPAVLLQQARSNPSRLVRENARLAANWNLTCFVFTHSLAALCFVTAVTSFVFEIDALFTWAIIFVCLACLTVVAHLVVTVIGIVIAGRRVFRPMIAIPFFGEADPAPERLFDAGRAPLR